MQSNMKKKILNFGRFGEACSYAAKDCCWFCQKVPNLFQMKGPDSLRPVSGAHRKYLFPSLTTRQINSSDLKTCQIQFFQTTASNYKQNPLSCLHQRRISAHFVATKRRRFSDHALGFYAF